MLLSVCGEPIIGLISTVLCRVERNRDVFISADFWIQISSYPQVAAESWPSSTFLLRCLHGKKNDSEEGFSSESAGMRSGSGGVQDVYGIGHPARTI